MIVIKNKFIPFGNYILMNVYGIILFSKLDTIPPIKLNHEKIHSRQILECAIVASLILLILILLFNISYWWFTVSLSSFYIWYGLEYLIIRIFGHKDKQINRYYEVSFEEEAHNNDANLGYLKNRKPFAWIKYLNINSYGTH